MVLMWDHFTGETRLIMVAHRHTVIIVFEVFFQDSNLRFRLSKSALSLHASRLISIAFFLLPLLSTPVTQAKDKGRLFTD